MVKWGVLGLGKIAKKFVSDLAMVSNAELHAVASRSVDKAKAFAQEFNAKNTYGSYQELFNDKDVQVIYIATPHQNHSELSIQAMQHGKHVLCEKPLGVNAKQVKAMIAASVKNDVFLMEGLWSRFNPTIKKIKELIAKGEIGDLRYLYANFAFYALDRDKNGRLLNPELAGGSLLDIGIYPIFLAYLFLGKPDAIMATSNFYETGAEIQTSMIFSYANAQAMLNSGLSSNSDSIAEFSGSKGSILVPKRWHEAEGYAIQKDGISTSFSLPLKGVGFTYEIEEVQQCILEDKKESSLWTHKNSLELAELLDAVRKQAGVVFPFEE